MGKKVILMVDDETRATESYRLALQINDFDIRFFNDGESALEYVASDGRVDAIVLDLSMAPFGKLTAAQTHYGLGTGIELYREFRKHLKKTPVFVLTNVMQDAIVQQLTYDDDNLVGPLQKLLVGPLELSDRVREAIQKRVES
jgi:CheY-like chemotaxis protein